MRLPLRGSGALAIVPLLLPIVAGRPHDGDSAVVGLLRGYRIFCTGVLIAPRVVLTAGHCLTRGRPDGVFFGSAPDRDGRRMAALETRIDPAFEATAARHDLGLVLLAERASARPAPLGPQPRSLSAGGPIRIIGFGTTSRGDRGPPRKRQGRTVLGRVLAGELLFGPSPSLTCDEDSGAPVFLDSGGRDVLVGIASDGDRNCSQWGRAARVDGESRAFIDRYLAATARGPRSAPVGSTCRDDLDCADEVCARLEGGGDGVCSVACFPEDPQACPPGLRCRANAAHPRAHACLPGR